MLGAMSATWSRSFIPGSRPLSAGLALALWACGGNVAIEAAGEPGATRDTPGAGGSASSSTSSGGLGGGHETLDSGADAPIDSAPDVPDGDVPDTCTSHVAGSFTCCAGKPCRGDCYDGTCKCAGITGGCWAPLICCGGCTTPAPGLCSGP